MTLVNRFLKKNINYHLRVSALVHVILILFCELQDRWLDVKYTDIDYVIFTDGARFALAGESPFDRVTYRYTPLLAWMLTPNILAFAQFGKVLFSLIDILMGWMLYSIIPANVSNRKLCAIIWLYNPLTLIISTRGSAESIVCSFVIGTLYFVTKRKQYVAAGLLYGLVIHFKIYPIIYAPSFYLAISSKKYWRTLLPNKPKVAFFLAAAVGFLVPTLGSYAWYGPIYLEEAWHYHLVRQDYQHNFSPYFYFYSLNSSDAFRAALSMFAFVPQSVAIVSISFYYLFSGSKQKKDLFMCLFVQTFAFVTLNKVITAQYFEWYMCLLPLVLPYIRLSTLAAIKLFAFWSFAIVQWLLPAYLLEFRQCSQCFDWLGYSSISFMLMHLLVIVYLHANFNAKAKVK